MYFVTADALIKVNYVIVEEGWKSLSQASPSLMTGQENVKLETRWTFSQIIRLYASSSSAFMDSELELLD